MIELIERLDDELCVSLERDYEEGEELAIDVNEYFEETKYNINTDNLHDEWKLELFIEHANKMTLEELQELFKKA